MKIPNLESKCGNKHLNQPELIQIENGSEILEQLINNNWIN